MLEFRPLVPTDSPRLRALARACFGPAGLILVRMGTAGFVALEPSTDGSPERVLGMVVLGTFRLGGKRYGSVDWLMTHPEARNTGIGGQLLQRADEWFSRNGINRVIATIESYNSSSFRLFQSAGFHKLGLFQQIRFWGLRLPLLWKNTEFPMSLTQDLWYRDREQPAEEAPVPRAASLMFSLRDFLFALGFQTLLFLMIELRWSTPTPLILSAGAAFASAALYLGSRTLPYLTGLALRGVEPVFHAWLGGFLLPVLISLAGGAMPFSGSVYPRIAQDSRPLRSPLGQGALWAAVALSGLYLLLEFLPHPQGPRGVYASTWNLLTAVLPWYYLFEVALPFYPFWGFLGFRIWSWSRLAWALAALAGVGMVVIRFLIP